MYALRSYNNDDVDFVRRDDFYVFDMETKLWEKLPSMIRTHDVEFLRLVYSDGFIYVIDQISKVLERFHMEENKWELLPEPPVDVYVVNSRYVRDTHFSVPIVYGGKLLCLLCHVPFSTPYSVSCGGFEQTHTHKILEYIIPPLVPGELF